MACGDCLDEFASECYTDYRVILDDDTSGLEDTASPSSSEDVNFNGKNIGPESACRELEYRQLGLSGDNIPLSRIPLTLVHLKFLPMNQLIQAAIKNSHNGHGGGVALMSCQFLLADKANEGMWAYGIDNGWITNLHFMEISKSIEAEDWETVSAWWVSYLGSFWHLGYNVDMLDTLLDWGIDNPLQAALIHTHLKDHEFDEIAQLVFQMQGPDEIPHKVKFLKDEGNRCFKNNDFLNAIAFQ
ncbi:hypothetical protein Cgig2_009123 [Carnegiea gigantea]|uniref:Uncharacterized protein n=1 Tax=Carnegiea gigantea TaxID=171969 RepID=A0A9Q1GU74_9CARY|nr:hypothetical protein Cgig2_009123 [Carnegiea gigantea]